MQFSSFRNSQFALFWSRLKTRAPGFGAPMHPLRGLWYDAGIAIGYRDDMANESLIDQINRAVADLLPDNPGAEMRANLRAVIQSALDRAGVVTREELEVQEAVLARTREKLEALEKKVAELEAGR